MSVFEIEGIAKRLVVCDAADIDITFRADGAYAYEISRKVMSECDEFLEELEKIGMDIKDVHYDDDNLRKAGYHEEKDLYAERSIRIRIPFDMKVINHIQEILQKGKYDYEVNISGDITNSDKLHIELAKEALKHSREEAEQLAEVLGVKVKCVESIRKEDWDENDEGMLMEQENVHYRCNFDQRTSDKLGASTIEERVNLKVKWILE